ncbi:MAG: hypothetical protein IPG00_15325 [Saprospiraceae bacterium]|nr:hypothetical protein [Saprospiraceae bacterium]
MNTLKKLIFILGYALWATTTFGQNFNKIYFEGKERNTFIWQVKAQIENTIISSLDLDCSNGHLCTNLIVTDLNGSVASNHEIFTGSGFLIGYKLGMILSYIVVVFFRSVIAQLIGF